MRTLPVILLLALVASACNEYAADSIVIQGATVIDPSSENSQPLVADILIEDGLIAEVGNDIHVPRAAEVIDAAGAYVIPGLADMHVRDG